MRFAKSQLLDGEKRLFKWLKRGEGPAGYLTLTEMDTKKKVRLYPPQYNGLYESMNLFRLKHNRNPNYVNLISTAKNSLVWNPQDNSYNCAPASLSMASEMLFHYKTESDCAKALGTSRSGTSPQQLIDNAGKLGFKIVPIERKAKAVRDSLRLGFPVITHFQTDQTKSCKGDYIGAFGHYSLIWGVTDTEYVLADPSKGVNRKYKFLCLDKSNVGYRQNYYSVRPL